ELGWRVGQRVAGTSHAGCGYCRMCRTGRYNLCENYGREPLHHQYGHYSQGADAEYVVHSIKSVFPLPDTIDLAMGAMVDTASIRQAVDVVRKGGRVAFTGVPTEGDTALPMQKIVLEEIDLFGVRANRNTMEEVIPLIESGRVRVAPLVTHTFRLDQYAEALH